MLSRRGRTIAWTAAIAVVALTMGVGARAGRAGPYAQTAASNQRTTLDGVYSETQAQRGKTVYTSVCSECHMEDLSGGGTAAGLRGFAFIQVWENRTLDDYFTRVGPAMPPDAPGKLNEKEYLDVIAFLLRENKFPAGPADLTRAEEALKKITIARPAK